MHRFYAYSLVVFAGAFAVGTAALAQTSASVTGTWRVVATGVPFTTGTLALQQTNTGVTGSYGQGGKLDGTFKTGTTQLDGNWGDPRGNGWLTITFGGAGNSFTGEWGYAGRKPSGTFTGTRVASASAAYPVVTGLFNVTVSGGPEFTARHLKLHQLGNDVVGNFGLGTQLGGTMAPDTGAMNGTWKGPNGSGWIHLRFASDSRSFQGEWGLTADSQPRGHISGSVVNTTQMWVHGLWETASSSIDFSGGSLRLDQNGANVTGVFKNGHLAGSLPRGSSVLVGRWRGEHGSGNVTLTFAADGRSFEGTWTLLGGSGGRIVGKRNVAASPALR
jgi:hypothetical protein